MSINTVGGKLVSKGKVLDDEAKTLKDYTIADKGQIIAMPNKARPAKKEETKKDDPKPTVTIQNNAAAASTDAAPAPAPV